METLLVNKLFELEGHEDALYTLCDGLEEDSFYSAGSDRLIVNWNLDNGRSIKVAAKATDTVYALCRLPGLSFMCIGNKVGEVHLIDLLNNAVIKNYKLYSQPVFDLKYATNHNLIIAAGGDGVITVLDANSFAQIKSIPASTSAARVIALHPNGTSMAVGFSDNNIRIFDLPSFKMKACFEAHTSSVFALHYSPDGSYLLSGSRDAHIKVWNTESFKLIQDIVAHLFTINTIAFHPSGKWFATGSRDKTLKIWDAKTFRLLKVLDKSRNGGHSHSINKLLWSHYKNRLISCGDDKKIRVWELVESVT